MSATLQNIHCDAIDYRSILGQFGWKTVIDFPVFYIYRNNEHFCAKRMFKIIIAKHFPMVTNEIMQCITIQAYNITNAELKLLNEINNFHSNGLFGTTFKKDEQICKINDLEQMVNYLYFILDRLREPLKPLDLDILLKCGFLRIVPTSHTVPFVRIDKEIYMPLIYLELDDIVMKNIKPNTKTISGWDLAYLKFCYKIHQINTKFFYIEHCEVISYRFIINYFPKNTKFIYYWPKCIQLEKFVSVNKLIRN